MGSAFDRGDDERSLLARLEQMLDREESLLAAHDAAGLLVLAEERLQLSARLVSAAQARRMRRSDPSARNRSEDEHEDAELVASYQRLRQRHEVRARVMQRHQDRTTRAIGVIAQAANQSSMYGSDGRVAMRWAGC